MDNSDNKRRETRLLDEIAVFIEMQSSPTADPTENMCITKTLDISENGLKLLADAPLPLHSFHQLCIECSPRRFFLVGQVAWVSEVDNGFSIGFALMESAQTQITAWQQFVAERLRQ